MSKFGKLALGMIGAAVVMGGAATAQAQVISEVSTILTSDDPTWENAIFGGGGAPCGVATQAGAGTIQRYQTRQMTVTTAGVYSMKDQALDVAGLTDARLGIYSGPFNPASPSSGCILTLDDTGSLHLDAGAYTIVLTPYSPSNLGTVKYTFSGLDAVTFAAPPASGPTEATPASVPTLSEWAMILFGATLAGGAALYIQRRRLTA